jgi:GTP cyclohydrolase I
MNYFTDTVRYSAEIREPLRKLIETLEPKDKEAIDNTPERFYSLLLQLLNGYDEDPLLYGSKEFDFVESKDLVIIKDIPFFSLCKHHILPFFGKAHVGYLPHEKVIGLSKIPRIIRSYSKRLQLQEKLGRQICDCLMKSAIKPNGVIVVLEAQHMCMQMRGIESIGSVTTTASLAGNFEDNSELKREFYHLVRR